MNTWREVGPMRVKIAALLLALLSSPAWSDATQDDWDKSAQPIVEEFAKCNLAHEDEAAKGYKTIENAANDVIERCRDYLENLKARLVQPPFNASSADADAAVAKVESDARGFIIKEIDKIRKGN
jgi:hypothetical protein